MPSGPGDLDLTIYGLRKCCRLAMKGSPTVLLLLFIDGEHVMVRTPLGEELQPLAPAFVSKRAGRAFLGYLDAQRRGLLGERHATRTRELSSAHGYDTKYAMHALRIAYQGIELIAERRITLPVPEQARHHLMAVRRGELPLEQVVADLRDRAGELEQAIMRSSLPEDGDREAVDSFLIRAYEHGWANGPPPSGSGS